MARKKRVGRPRKKKRAVKRKRFIRVSVIDGRLKRRKRKSSGRKRRLPPRVKTGKNKGRFRKRR